jgi:hypothetical protein
MRLLFTMPLLVASGVVLAVWCLRSAFRGGPPR